MTQAANTQALFSSLPTPTKPKVNRPRSSREAARPWFGDVIGLILLCGVAAAMLFLTAGMVRMVFGDVVRLGSMDLFRIFRGGI